MKNPTSYAESQKRNKLINGFAIALVVCVIAATATNEIIKLIN